MPGRLILEIGQTQVAVPVKGTVAQIRAAVRRFAEAEGIDTANLTETQIGEAVLRRLLRYVRDASRERQRQQLIAAEMAQIESVLDAENDLYDEA